MHAAHATLLAVLLLATSTDDAAAQQNTGGCKGQVSNVIAANGGECPENCFDTPAGQMIMTQGAPGSDWVVGITQCIKPSEAISFITWGPAGPNGECTAGCGDNKVEELPPGAPFTALTIPFGLCTGAPICVYVHDGTFRRGSAGTPLENVPESCISSNNQLCELCGAYLVTPTLSGGEGCSDEYTCTTGETCGAGGVCAGTPDDTLCNDNIACTGDVCVADQAPADVGVLPADVRLDDSGCGHKATDVAADSCNDTFSCSADLCVALPSVANAATTPAGATGDDTSGCFIDKETGPGCGDTPACASAVCVAGPPLVPGGPGCEITEIGNFCADKYGDCVGAVCSAADGVSAYAGGTVDSDGCSIPPQSTADAACVAPLAPAVDCGGYTCSLDPGAGSGCELTAGPASNADCLDGLANCQTSTCSNEGVCSAPTAIVDFCESKYEVCAEAMCAPGATADADGCITADDASANAGCQAEFPSDCAPATCNRASLPEGGTGTGLDGSGCTRAPDVSLCVPEFPCQLPACSAEGVCSFTSSNEVCQDPVLGFVPAGGFGPCVEAVCEPAALADATGCLARPVDPSPCALPSGACGTSVCNMATGECDVNSDVQPGQCSGCTTDCVDNVCVDGCNECQFCLDGVCEASPNALAQPCTGPGGVGTCSCSAEGECNFCRQECMFTGDTPADDVFRGCVEIAENPAISNCGRSCTDLCRLKCGGMATYSTSSCRSVMEGNCRGLFSAFDATTVLNGPCCACDAACLGSP